MSGHGLPAEADLVLEAETVRNETVGTLDPDRDPFVVRTLGSLQFERSRPPEVPGLVARIQGVYDGLSARSYGPYIEDILSETHRRHGVAGEVLGLGNGNWLYRWLTRDQ
jgi:hypothetical protein